MNPREKWLRRQEKLDKKKHGMRVQGRSVFTLQEILRRKAEKAQQDSPKKKTEAK